MFLFRTLHLFQYPYRLWYPRGSARQHLYFHCCDASPQRLFVTALCCIRRDRNPFGSATKPNNQIPCKCLLQGSCKKGKDCDFSHAGINVALAANSTNKEQRKEKQARKAQKATTYAAAIVEGDECAISGAGPCISGDEFS